MSRPRDRISANGLLPRMEAIARKNGFTYRYHPMGEKPINLGHDKQAALRKVLDMNGLSGDRGTLNELWRLYSAPDSAAWMELADSSRADYTQSSKQLLMRFGKMAPGEVRPAYIARYLRVERAPAPVRANREFALLSNLMNFAIERGELETNPCKQVRRNKERPRKNPPEAANLEKFLAWAWAQKGQPPILAGMAEFASLAGNRGIEFRELTWIQAGQDKLRLMRAKQRAGQEVVEEIPMSPMLEDLFNRLRPFAKDPRHGWVFPNADGNAYTAQAFKLGFNRLKKSARAAGALGNNFTFHDLRSYYVTNFKARYGQLPELHANPATTAKVYDGTKVIKRNAL